MALNSVSSTNIINILSALEQRANTLEAMLQGAPIDSVRIGTAVITNAKIADGAIETANIDDAAITNAKISSLSAVKVTAGTISADRIGANSITADKLDVNSLSAISANFGTVTAGSVTGLTITAPTVRTSTGSDRIELAGGLMFFLNASTELYQASPTNGIFFFGAGVGFVEAGGSTFRGVMGTASDGDFVIASQNSPLILIQALGNPITLAADAGDVNFWADDFQINGSTKSAIVPVDGGYRALYCVESPQVWFFDVLSPGQPIDPMFLEVTTGEIKTITNKNGYKLVFRYRRGFDTLRLETKSKEEFDRNNAYWGHQQ